MTNFRKAVSVWLCLWFFIVLAVLPEPFFLRENVYRQLPLYCFLEEQKLMEPEMEDRETTLLLMEANGAYLGQRLKDEQEMYEKLLEEAEQEKEQQRKKTDSENTQGKQRSAIEKEKKDKMQDNKGEEKKAEKDAQKSDGKDAQKKEAAKAAAAAGLSAEQLSDPAYLLENFFLVDPQTAVREGLLDAGWFLEQDFSGDFDKGTSEILIYHSHSQEAFADSREGVVDDTIVGIGKYLTKLLKKKYGYRVYHVTESFDLAGGELNRNDAYDYAGEYLETFLKEHPRVEVIIDLHRDGVPEDRRLVTEIGGKKTAQVMLFNGLSHTVSQGEITYLPNPYIEENLAFSFQLELQADIKYPGFYRGIYLAGYRYNLHFRPKSILLEAGAQTNTVQEVKNAMIPFAEILDKVLEG